MNYKSGMTVSKWIDMTKNVHEIVKEWEIEMGSYPFPFHPTHPTSLNVSNVGFEKWGIL